MKIFFNYLRQTLFACACLGMSLAQAGAEDSSADQLLVRAESLLREIDADSAGTVWDEASPLLRSSMRRSEFINGLKRDRTESKVASRKWTLLNRFSLPVGNGSLPQGDYFKVLFLGVDQAGARLDEAITFKREGKDKWEMTNYFIKRESGK